LRGAAQGALARCLIETGELEQAESVLSSTESDAAAGGVQAPLLLSVRAQLRFAQLRPRDALDDALEAGRRLESVSPGANPSVIAWRSTAALAQLALGERDRARELASDELEQARRLGVSRVVIRNLRVLGLAARGREGIELLTEAVRTGDDHPPRLEHVHALVDLGAALRRRNQRAAAREPLRRGLELAHLGGAEALAQRAQKELFATGARPRRAMLSGPESLTPSERGVAELAAGGLTTNEVAKALFVSRKTVEFHLRHIYRKLDVRSRSELTRAMGERAPE
jgi:DNA-binding CsgD family transcriptional regulator